MPRNEPIMSDSATVIIGQLVVVDGVIRTSPIAGTVAQLKSNLSASVIRAPDLAARRGSLLFTED